MAVFWFSGHTPPCALVPNIRHFHTFFPSLINIVRGQLSGSLRNDRRITEHIAEYSCTVCIWLLTLVWPGVVWLSGIMMRHHVDMVVMTLGSGHLRPGAPCLDVVIVWTLTQTWNHVCPCNHNKSWSDRESLLYIITLIYRQCWWQPL